MATGVALSLPGLPLDWFDQFRLEARFGFNTTTQKTWWLDRLKGLLLSARAGLSAAGAGAEIRRVDRAIGGGCGRGAPCWGFNC